MDIMLCSGDTLSHFLFFLVLSASRRYIYDGQKSIFTAFYHMKEQILIIPIKRFIWNVYFGVSHGRSNSSDK